LSGPGAYKIPTANDVPIDFRVTLLQNTPEPRAVHSSKAVGEPPFHLGAAVFFALKDAVGSHHEVTMRCWVQAVNACLECWVLGGLRTRCH